MNRRGFFQRTIGAIAAAVLPLPKPRVWFTPVAGIDATTFKFWRNQQGYDPAGSHTGLIIAQAWESVVRQSPADEDKWLFDQLSQGTTIHEGTIEVPLKYQ